MLLDDPGSIGELVLVLALILCSAFFSMSETALTSLSKFKIRSMAEDGKKGAKHVEKVSENKEKLLSTVLIGGNFANIALGSLITAFAMSVAGSNAASIAIATVTATLIVLIFGELTPKTVALEYPEKIALLVVRPLRAVMLLLSPVAAALNFVISGALYPFGLSLGKKEISITEDELKSILDVGLEEGVIESDEHKMIDNIIEFDYVHAKDIMTPRTDIVAVDIEFTYNEVLEAFSGAGLSRIPVYEDNIDHVVGIVHIKDFISADSKTFSVRECMREPFFTLELKRTRELFKEMRRENSSLALVLDEYGGTAGLVSMEDLIEEIVGEIFDEHDDVNNEIEQISENEYIVNGAMKIDDFNEFAGSSLTSEEYESVGGYVMGLAGGVPEAGMSLHNGEIAFTVEGMERNRVERLRIIVEAGGEDGDE